MNISSAPSHPNDGYNFKPPHPFRPASADGFGTNVCQECQTKQWDHGTYKAKEAIAAASCPVCGAKPPSTDPIPEGWIWDCIAADDPYLWCPEHAL